MVSTYLTGGEKLPSLILTMNFASMKKRIKQYIQEAENSHSYTCSKCLVKQEKFQERIEIYSKDWCRTL